MLLAAGIVVLLVTVVLFWRALPRGGRVHRFVGTAWEPYVGVAFTSGVALGLSMVLAGVLGSMS